MLALRNSLCTQAASTSSLHALTVVLGGRVRVARSALVSTGLGVVMVRSLQGAPGAQLAGARRKMYCTGRSIRRAGR